MISNSVLGSYNFSCVDRTRLFELLIECKEQGIVPEVVGFPVNFTSVKGDTINIATQYVIRFRLDIRYTVSYFAIRFDFGLDDIDLLDVTQNMTTYVADFIVWLREHDEDIMSGWTKPTFSEYIITQHVMDSLVCREDDFPSSLTAIAVQGVDTPKLGLKRKPRIRKQRLNQLNDKLTAIQKRIQAIRDDHPGINQTNTWKEWGQLISEEFNSSSCDDSGSQTDDVDGDIRRVPLGRLTSKLKNSKKRK